MSCPQLVIIKRVNQVVIQSPGPQGAPGSGGSAAVPFVHLQSVASAEWVVNHNLGRFVSVSVLDSGGNALICQVLNVSVNQVRVYLNTAITGRALCF